MKKYQYTFFVFFTFIFFTYLSLFSLTADSRYNPDLNWKVVEAPHFSIYFFQTQENSSNIAHDYSYERVAQEIANIAEKVYTDVNSLIGPPEYNHFQKIAIILEDFTDYALGFATTLPHRIIRISLTPPNAKTFDMKFRNWLKMVITHEYTHIAHFEMRDGYSSALRALFGQIMTPNALQPIWSIEGLAVYNETKFTKGGRGTDTRYDMYLRMAALEDNFNSIDQISGYNLTSWPGGTATYNYGQSLVHYITDTYSEDILIAINNTFIRHPLLGINYAVNKNLGISLNTLFQNWKNELQKKYTIQRKNIIAKMPITTSRQLTNYQYWVDHPTWMTSSEGQKIIVKVSNPHTYPFIESIDPSSNSLPLTYSEINEHVLVKRTYGRSTFHDTSPDNTYLIYAKLDNYEQYNSFYDLYVYDIDTKREIRLSSGLRASDPAFSPFFQENDHQKIAAIINKSGTGNLALIDLSSLKTINNNPQNEHHFINDKDITYLTSFHDGTQLYHPTWSPDGKNMALSVWKNGSLDIYTLDIGQHQNSPFNVQLGPIFQDRHNDLSPEWSPDGQFIFFSSDRTGIYNIFAFSPSNKILFQVTNVLGGAFEPALSPDGKKLAYIEYHASGYELHVMDIESSQWIKTEYNKSSTSILSTSSISQKISSENIYPVHPYQAFSSFWPPTYWIPAVNYSETDLSFGFSGELYDVLGYHSLPFTMTYDLLENELEYSLNYYNYSNKSTIHGYCSGVTSSLSHNNNNPASKFSIWENGYTGLNITFPKIGNTPSETNSRTYRQLLSLGYQYECFSDTIPLDAVTNFIPNNNLQNKISSLRLIYSYSDAEKYGLSISPEQGNALSFSYEYADAFLSGNYIFNKWLFDARKYIPLPSLHHVLALRLVAGHSSKNMLDLENFQLGGHLSANNLANIDVNNFALRGYPINSFKGNNLASASFEYRFPIANIERGLKQGPLFVLLERLSGSLFLDIGNAWASDSINQDKNIEHFEIKSNLPELHTGIGVELKADLNLKYDSPFTLRLGAAKALSHPIGYDFYCTLGTSF